MFLVLFSLFIKVLFVKVFCVNLFYFCFVCLFYFWDSNFSYKFDETTAETRRLSCLSHRLPCSIYLCRNFRRYRGVELIEN